MNKEQAVAYMIGEIEKIEKRRQRANLEPNKQKKEAVDQIYSVLNGVQIDDEN